jgi:branched-chain amino acid transport system permease protein
VRDRRLWLDVALGGLFVAGAFGFGVWAEEANPYRLAQARTVLLYAVLALSWDLLARTGQLSLAHAAFHGLGAYTSVLVVRATGLEPALGVVLGGLASAAVAIPLGWVTLRLHGIYFAIATLAFSEVLRIAANQIPWAGGATGLVTVPLFGGRTVLQYLFLLGVLAALMALSRALQASRWAYAFAAVRTNEAVARALGVPVVGCKVAAFAVSAFFAGLSGATYAHAFLFINPLESFHLGISVAALVAPIFGGLYSTAGPVLGAVLLRGGEDLLRERLGAGYPLLYGLILAAAILFLPRGLVGACQGWSLRRPLARPAGRAARRAVAEGTEEA